MASGDTPQIQSEGDGVATCAGYPRHSGFPVVWRGSRRTTAVSAANASYRLADGGKEVGPTRTETRQPVGTTAGYSRAPIQKGFHYGLGRLASVEAAPYEAGDERQGASERASDAGQWGLQMAWPVAVCEAQMRVLSGEREEEEEEGKEREVQRQDGRERVFLQPVLVSPATTNGGASVEKEGTEQAERSPPAPGAGAGSSWGGALEVTTPRPTGPYLAQAPGAGRRCHRFGRTTTSQARPRVPKVRDAWAPGGALAPRELELQWAALGTPWPSRVWFHRYLGPACTPRGSCPPCSIGSSSACLAARARSRAIDSKLSLASDVSRTRTRRRCGRDTTLE
ncbi:hypothetical protein PCL_01349 [Purpureocillium lilacinum]|uniref:Uncharacterized protein n=1 Tax=Purpureocillium lilacinum TaxID=33203 RepID=A0A2U3E3B5_PURLI|nr:hypothetical protein PCL_01349 [Purpureocillium lilacinum]